MSDVLAISALGDAIGVPYEFTRSGLPLDEPLPLEVPDGGYSIGDSGRWSDDTSMALCIALAAFQEDLRTEEGLDAVTTLFKSWATEDGFGIGNQTSSILSRLPQDQLVNHKFATALSLEMFAEAPDNSAGNGSLMRVHPVALLPFAEDELVNVAVKVTEVTHADPRCLEASILWVAMMKHALDNAGVFRPNVGVKLLPKERQDYWNEVILEALTTASYEFGTRGWWVVPSFQQALSAVHKNLSQLAKNPMAIFREILACGPCDSDTICAIAGGLMGSLGVKLEQFPEEVVSQVHGIWPARFDLYDLRDLEASISKA